MRLLWLISWPYVRRHLLRCVLTTAGIVLGVSVFVAMHTANQSILYAFGRTIDKIAGTTQLQVTAGEPGFDEEVLERVQSVPEVRVAVPVIEAAADTGLKGQGNLLILGVDMTGDRGLRDYDLESGDEEIVDDPLVFLAQPDSLIVTREFANRNRLVSGSRVPMRTAEGEKQFTVRGIMSSSGLGQAFGGNLAIMDVYAAQKVFGRGRKFDRIDIAVKEGVPVEQCQAQLQKLLGPGFQVDLPSGRGKQFESMLRSTSISINISSVFALFIGLFIIYNSFAIAVTQRRYEIGILRALGATRAQIRTLFLTESAIAGLLGSTAGILLGELEAKAMAGFLANLVQQGYGVAQRVESISADPRLIASSLAIGVGTSIVAAWIPSRNAARVDPVQALQKGKYQVLSAGENRIRQILAAVLAIASVACLFFATSHMVVYVGYALSVIAAILLTPTLALWLSRLLRPALHWLRPVEGTLAADSLIQSPRRTSGAVAALMLSLTIVVGFAGTAKSSTSELFGWMRDSLNPDLFVTASQDISNRTFHFPASMGDGLKQIPGVDEVQRVRAPRIIYRNTPIMLISVELEPLSRRVRRRVVAGDAGTMYAMAGAGKGVLISDTFARLQDLHLGETIEIPTPSGPLRMPILGVIIDYSDQQGSILIDRSVFVRYWKDDTVNIFRVYLKPGTAPAAVKERILEKYGDRRLFVLSNREVLEYVERIMNQYLGLTYLQIAVAVLVAVLGIVNALTVSIIDRRRELGVLQAVGALRNQVRRTIWMEALTIAVLGIILGLALGVINLYYSLAVTDRLIGLRLPYLFPFGISLFMAPVILAAAFLAALWPAESAVRGSLVEALEYE